MTRYFRGSRRFRSKRVRWNVENQLLFSQITGDTQVSAEIVKHGVDNRTGTRTIMTVKNFRINTSLVSSADALPGVVWALVYVPSGLRPSAISGSNGSSVYEPSQYVINCGVWDFDAGPLRVQSSLSRSLHPGDSVYLQMRAVGAATGAVVNFQTVVSYAAKQN